MADGLHLELDQLHEALWDQSELSRPVVFVSGGEPPEHVRALMQTLGVRVEVRPVSPPRSSERLYTAGRTRTMGDFAAVPAANGHGPRADWIDYRASISRVHKREQAGDEALTCKDCGTETDVSDVVHSPQCDVVIAAQPRGAGSWTATQALAAVEHWVESRGGPPTHPDWKQADNEHPSYAVCVQLFGSWKEMLRQAGWEPASGRRVAQQIRPVEEPEPPQGLITPLEQAEPGMTEEVVVGVRAPTHVDGAKKRNQARKNRWTRELIIAAIQAFAAEHGRPPVVTEWLKGAGVAYPSKTVIAKHFGGWANAIEAAGFERPTRGRRTKGSGPEPLAQQPPDQRPASPAPVLTERGSGPDTLEAPPGLVFALITAARAFLDTLEQELG